VGGTFAGIGLSGIGAQAVPLPYPNLSRNRPAGRCRKTTNDPLEAQMNYKATVRVMRSHDYCHFETSLSSDQELTLDEIDQMRKEAALLVDEAIRQYRISKKAEDRRLTTHVQMEAALDRQKRLETKSRAEWTVDEAAFMRAYADREFWNSLHEDDYIYEDDPEREHHFSMLRRFQDAGTTIKA
jgi:hypothetical protein